MAGQPVAVLVVDPDAGYHRVVQGGEQLVDADGQPVSGGLAITLGLGNDADAQQIKNLADPTADQDAATKKYVDSQIGANNDLDEILANGNDAMGQSIVGLCGIYFDTGCEDGESSSSSAGETEVWIAPDHDTLVYRAAVHDFQSAVTINGGLTFVNPLSPTKQMQMIHDGSGADFQFRLQNTGDDFEFWWAGNQHHAFEQDGLYLERADGGLIQLVMTATTEACVLMYGIGAAAADAGSITLHDSTHSWKLRYTGQLYTGEQEDLLLQYDGGSGYSDWLRFDVSASTIEASQRLLAPDGEQSAPAYSFTNSTGTGLYRASSIMYVARAGVAAMSWSVSSGVETCKVPGVFGVGSVSYAIGLYVSKTFSFNGVGTGMNLAPTFSGAYSQAAYGIDMRMKLSASAIRSQFIGFWLRPDLGTGASASVIYGFYFSTGQLFTGSATSVIGGYFDQPTIGTSTNYSAYFAGQIHVGPFTGTHTAATGDMKMTGEDLTFYGNSAWQTVATKQYVDDQIVQAIDDISAFGQMYEYDGTTSQTLTTADQWYKVQAFGQSDNLKDITADTANDQYVIDEAGTYLILCNPSFSGTPAVVYKGAIYVNGVRQEQLRMSRKLGAAGDVGSTGINGLVYLDVGDVVDLRMMADTNGAGLTIVDINLTMAKLDALVGSSSSSTL